MEKEEIFDRLNQCRKALLETLDKLPQDTLDSAVVEGNWTVKQILCHLTAWELTVLEPLVGYVQVDQFKPEIIQDHDAWNSEQTAKRQAWTVQQVIEEMQATRELLISEAGSLTSEQWDRILPAPWGGQGCIANLLGGLAWHENEHLQTIHNWHQSQIRPG